MDFFLVKFSLKEDYSHVLVLNFFYSSILTRIGNQLVTLLCIDNHTIELARGRYARLCVQIDINKPLVACIRISRFTQPIQYEGINTI
ncbi:hypothetical protein CFOL_v3_22706 [Cephalotus follicularis]|uniref:Uncharacterized protein n=1 Tax=Cephalotus follicularis TaxID=3775 RepID=A0A1Q3CGP3_CEPFO|nr:hypothetical protein CFOL_v3_22706 [Cephalotus follicularis]